MPNRAIYPVLGDSMPIDDYAGGPGRGAASLLWRNRDKPNDCLAVSTADPGEVRRLVAGQASGAAAGSPPA